MHEAVILLSNSLNFPDPECCANSQRTSTTQKKKPAGDLQTFYFLNEAIWLRRKEGILHFCTSTSANYGHSYTRLSGSKLVLKAAWRSSFRLSMRQCEDRQRSDQSPKEHFLWWIFSLMNCFCLAGQNSDHEVRSHRGQYHCDHISITVAQLQVVIQPWVTILKRSPTVIYPVCRNLHQKRKKKTALLYSQSKVYIENYLYKKVLYIIFPNYLIFQSQINRILT